MTPPLSVQDLPTGAENIDVSDLGKLPSPGENAPASSPSPSPASSPSPSPATPTLADLATPGVVAQGQVSDPLAGLVEPKGSTSSQVRQMGQSTTRAVVQSSPVIAGAIAGGKVGTTLGALAGPPGAIIGGVVGTIGGGFAGVLAGS